MKRILVGVLAFVMLLQPVSMVMAEEPETLYVPSTVQVRGESTGTFADSVTITQGGAVDFRAWIDMSIVRETYVAKLSQARATIDTLFGADTPEATDKKDQLNQAEVTGSFQLKMTYPAELVLSEELENGSAMEGFNDGAKVVFKESSRQVKEDATTKTLEISVAVRSGIKVGDLETYVESWLADIEFIGSGFSAPNVGEYTIKGELSGNTTIQLGVYGESLNYVAQEQGGVALQIPATIIVEESQGGFIPGGTTGGGIHPSSPLYPGGSGDKDEDGQAIPDDPKETGVAEVLNTDEHMLYLIGVPGGMFEPERDMTRAEAAMMFYRLLRNKNVEGDSTFVDVPADEWYAEAVRTLAAMHIIKGIDDVHYEPERSITRAEFVTITLRFTSKAGNGSKYFKDVASNHWAYDAIMSAAGYGWINGYADNTFRPDGQITRAEVTAITNNVLGRNADKEYIKANLDALTNFSDLDDSHWAFYDIMEATNAHDYTKTKDAENWK